MTFQETVRERRVTGTHLCAVRLRAPVVLRDRDSPTATESRWRGAANHSRYHVSVR